MQTDLLREMQSMVADHRSRPTWWGDEWLYGALTVPVPVEFVGEPSDLIDGAWRTVSFKAMAQDELWTYQVTIGLARPKNQVHIKAHRQR